jgi:hypothetical protein
MTISPRLAPGETPKAVDPAEISKNVYRGGMWELIRIGKPLPAIAQGALLVALLVFAIAGLPWPSIIFSGVLIGIAIWSQRNVLRWANEHNERVAPADQPKPARSAKPARRPNRRRS